MIEEEKLNSWAKAPSASKYAYTYDEVKNALSKYLIHFAQKNHGYEIKTSNYDVYLQGSYANSTNINGESDVDIVIELKSIFYYNIDQLTDTEKESFHKNFSTSPQYKFSEFKKDVHESLNSYFSETVEYKNKCLKIPKTTTRVNADVIPSFSYKKYGRFSFYSTEQYVEGIQFYNTSDRSQIINYPKEHKKNCEALNHDTEGDFKSMIRIFKNIKKELVEKKIIDEKVVCSYFIENLLYNCTAPCFNGNYQKQMIAILQFLFNAIKQGRLSNFLCANGQDLLFSDSKWNTTDAETFILKSADYFLNNS